MDAEGGILVREHATCGASVSATPAKSANPGPACNEANCRRSENDDRKRNAQEENGDERGSRQSDHDAILEGTPSDPLYRLENHCENGRLEAEEEGIHCRKMPEGCI